MKSDGGLQSHAAAEDGRGQRGGQPEGACLHEEEADIRPQLSEHEQQSSDQQKPSQTVQLPDAK